MKAGIKAIILLSFLAMLFSFAVGEVVANTKVQLMVNGVVIEPDTPAQIVHDRTFVPVRFVAENLGANVQWDENSRTVTIIKDDQTIHLVIGQKHITVNGKVEQMDVAPYIDGIRTMVPIRFVSDCLGSRIGWQPQTRTAVISDPLHVVVNDSPFDIERAAINYNGEYYYPVFEIAHALHINVKQSQNGDHVFSYRQEIDNSGFGYIGNKQLITIQQTLPKGHTLQIDQTHLVKIEWIEKLLGAHIAFNEEGNRLSVEKEVYLLKLEDITFNAGEYFIHIPGVHEGEIETLLLKEPHRIVMDIKNASLGEGLMPQAGSSATTIPIGYDTVDQLRVSQFSTAPMSIRLVFDANKRSEIHYFVVEEGIIVTVQERKPIVVIDAGHGGRDPGAIGRISTEAGVVLQISNKIIALLEADPDFVVHATRTTDVFLTLEERADFANNLGADLFISVHANASTNRNAGGTETYIFPNSDRTFGAIVHRHLMEATKLTNRGLKEANFSVLRRTTMPAVLIEIAFMSNVNEEKLLNDPAFQDRVAYAMYQAVREYEFGK